LQAEKTSTKAVIKQKSRKKVVRMFPLFSCH
jgi:hypothetical protein